MSLDARVVRSLGTFRLDVDLSVKSGETVAILGPNGSGKSTLFRCLAGLLPVDEGRIVLDGETLDDAATNAFIRPEQRPVAVVFQEYLLFPNLTALENIAFGLRARGVDKRDARARAAEWLERVGLADHAGHRPRALSGGQAQRVALARALATEPRLLLLDEPLAALDVGRRADVRRDLRRHLGTFDGVRLLVTHDPVDGTRWPTASSCSKRATSPRSAHSTTSPPDPARGTSPTSSASICCAARSLDGAIVTANGAHIVPADPVDGDTFAVIQPHSVALYLTAPEGSPRNVWSALVADVDRQADRVRVRLTGEIPLVAEITPNALDELALQPGDTVWATVKATEISTYPA